MKLNKQIGTAVLNVDIVPELHNENINEFKKGLIYWLSIYIRGGIEDHRFKDMFEEDLEINLSIKPSIEKVRMKIEGNNV